MSNLSINDKNEPCSSSTSSSFSLSSKTNCDNNDNNTNTYKKPIIISNNNDLNHAQNDNILVINVQDKELDKSNQNQDSIIRREFLISEQIESDLSNETNRISAAFNDLEYWKISFTNFESLSSSCLHIDDLNEAESVYSTNSNERQLKSQLIEDSYYSKKFSQNSRLPPDLLETISRPIKTSTDKRKHKKSFTNLNSPILSTQNSIVYRTHPPSTPTNSSLNIITTNRFLHQSSSSLSIDQEDIKPACQTRVLSSNNQKQEIETNSPSSNVLNVVSKLQNWFKKPLTPTQSNINQQQQQQQQNLKTPSFSLNMSSLNEKQNINSSFMNQISLNNNNNDSASLSYNLPLSIEFIKKLKRPVNVPAQLEYSQGNAFQGHTLEEWLMHSLEEHIINSSCKQASSSNAKLGGGAEIEPSENTLLNRDNLSTACLASTPSTATNSATSLIIEVTNFNEQDQDNEEEKRSMKKLNSDSYKAAIQNLCADSNNNSNLSIQNESKNNKNAFDSFKNLVMDANSINNQNQANLLYKKQEATYYVQQFLTNLLALGVLEYESGFENAINKTFKV